MYMVIAILRELYVHMRGMHYKTLSVDVDQVPSNKGDDMQDYKVIHGMTITRESASEKHCK
jgi:hypothetical protein